MTKSDRRGSERVMLKIPIRVISFGGITGDFSEETYTVQVNRAGARIALKHRVAPDDSLRVINLENLREADFRVVGQLHLPGNEVTEWGVQCLEEERNIWGIEFPPPLDLEGSRAGALLECRGCQKKSLQVLTLVEVDILDSTGTLDRLCDQCGQLSSWVVVEVSDSRPGSPAPAESSPAPPVEAWDKKTERRVHKRVAMKLPVLVRNQKDEQEISKTENVSKGGLAVCLSMTLAVGEIVSVDCPYTAGSQGLARKAEVRRRSPFVAGQKWFYGFRYLA